ncbi:hypothetical protein [Streptacidiphilus fuscans]|uniref:Secreted protein n=1 Tax=Streptacidiphilus fuscans TaxID=2789292 RepID=A0A931FG51_9ACTN|nr:hypothetical protein [Streptacidiphilus fuscans]MBF9073547.1 hypothetical protein [Streptacidiphilus fuscans]
MSRGRHRQASSLRRTLPSLASTVLALAALAAALLTNSLTVQRVLVISVAVGACAIAALLRQRDRAAELDVVAEQSARTRDQERFEERIAELEYQSEVAEEQVKRLERRVLAHRSQVAQAEAANAHLLRERARIVAEQALREAETRQNREVSQRGTRPTPTLYLRAASALRTMERRAEQAEAGATLALRQAQLPNVARPAQSAQPVPVPVQVPVPPAPVAPNPGIPAQSTPKAGTQDAARGADSVSIRQELPGAPAAPAAPTDRPTEGQQPAAAEQERSNGPSSQVPAQPSSRVAAQPGSALDAFAARQAATGRQPSGSTAVTGTGGAQRGLVAPYMSGPGRSVASGVEPSAAMAPAWARAALPPLRPAAAVPPTAMPRQDRATGTFNFFSRQETAIGAKLGEEQTESAAPAAKPVDTAAARADSMDTADVVGDEAVAAQAGYVAAPTAPSVLPTHDRERIEHTLVDLTAEDETEPIDVRAVRAV